MTSALYTLQYIIDDYGNAIPVYTLEYSCYHARACFFHALGMYY